MLIFYHSKVLDILYIVYKRIKSQENIGTVTLFNILCDCLNMIETIGNLFTSVVVIIVVLTLLYYFGDYLGHIAVLLPILALGFFLFAPIVGILSPVLAVLIVPVFLGGLIYMAMSIMG